MKIEISEYNMTLIQEALATQLRLLESYVHPDEAIIEKIMNFQRLKADVDELLLRQ